MTAREWTQGWYPGLSLAEYLSIPAMSASGMEAFRRSPAHFRWEQLHPKEPTPAMVEGTALHLALLEPHLFEGRYIPLGQCDAVKKGDGQRCTNQAIVVRSDHQFCGVRGHDPLAGEPMPANVHVMSADALDRVHGMRDAVLRHPDAGRFFTGKGDSEITGVWRDEATGVLCKLRLDRDIGRAAIFADVKSCPDASRDAFRRHAGRMGYHRKASWYRRGMRALGKAPIGCVLIAVEQNPPHGCQLFLLRDEQLEALDRQTDPLLYRYAECLRSGEWPAYDPGLRDFEVLPWDMPGDGASEPGFVEEGVAA